MAQNLTEQYKRRITLSLSVILLSIISQSQTRLTECARRSSDEPRKKAQEGPRLSASDKACCPIVYRETPPNSIKHQSQARLHATGASRNGAKPAATASSGHWLGRALLFAALQRDSPPFVLQVGE